MAQLAESLKDINLSKVTQLHLTQSELHYNPLNNKKMKKYIAKNGFNGQKAFCTYEILKTGILRVSYFMPKAGFSVIWDRLDNFCKISGVNTTSDGRKTIVSFLIHPNYWMGYGFHENTYNSIFNAMDICFMNKIKLL